MKKIIKKIDDYFYKRLIAKLRNTECKYKVYIDDTKKLKDKVVIVTGGSGAIGSAIAFKLATEGAIVGVCGRNKKAIEMVVNKIKENEGKAFSIVLDVTNEKLIEKTFEEVKNKYGRIDILINNAGGGAREKSKNIFEQDIKIIDDILNVNLRGTILCSRKASQYMIKQKSGKIVNIASIVGINGLAKYSEYAASKGGIIVFTKSLAMELAQYNINVNCVSPGKVNQILFDKPLKDIYTDKCYMNRLGRTDDISNTVEFLVREESSYITGQNIIVDGGRSLGLKGE